MIYESETHSFMLEKDAVDPSVENLVCSVCCESEYYVKKVNYPYHGPNSSSTVYICEPCPNVLFKGDLVDLRALLEAPLSGESLTQYQYNVSEKMKKEVSLEYLDSTHSCSVCHSSKSLVQRSFVEDDKKYIDRELDSTDYTVLFTCNECQTHSFEYYLDNNLEDVEVLMRYKPEGYLSMASYSSDLQFVTPRLVCKSAQGYYLGDYSRDNPKDFDEDEQDLVCNVLMPHSRHSNEYWATEEEAIKAFFEKAWTFNFT